MIMDAAAAMQQGRRPYQEDALGYGIYDEIDAGYVVLADGMGGHAAGDKASNLVVSEVAQHISEVFATGAPTPQDIPEVLRALTLRANASLRDYANASPEAKGLGTTLVVPLLSGNKLHWVSVGDSPLFLFREGRLHQINEDHSFGAQLDQLLLSGELDMETAQHHPDRHCLTSALTGLDIPRIDLTSDPITMQHGDIIVACSDGLNFLDTALIEETVRRTADAKSQTIIDALLKEIEALNDVDQDNVAIAVVKLAERQCEPVFE